MPPRQKSFLLMNQYIVQCPDQSQFVITVTKTSALSIYPKILKKHNQCPEVHSATVSFQTTPFVSNRSIVKQEQRFDLFQLQNKDVSGICI